MWGKTFSKELMVKPPFTDVGLQFLDSLYRVRTRLWLLCVGNITILLQIPSIATRGCPLLQVSFWVGQERNCMLHKAQCVRITFIMNSSLCKAAAVLFNPTHHTDDINDTLNSTVYTNKLQFHHAKQVRSIQNRPPPPEKIFAADDFELL